MISEVSLSGGYRPGSLVFSLIDHDDEKGQVRKGDKGKVIGAARSDAHDLLCKFPDLSWNLNVRTWQVSLAGGLRPGSVILSLVDFANGYGQVRKGDKGKVIDSSDGDQDELLFEFPNCAKAKLKTSEVSLSGGFRPGSLVFSLIDHDDEKGQIRKGDKGKVIDSSDGGHDELLCEFPKCAKATLKSSQVVGRSTYRSVVASLQMVISMICSGPKLKTPPVALRLTHAGELSDVDISAAFTRSARGQFCITTIERVQEAALVHLVSSYLTVVEQRRVLNPIFDPLVAEGNQKQQLIDVLRSCFDTERLAGRGLQKANVLLAWHGPSDETAAKSIIKHGFAPLSTTDKGYFGSGRYATLESAYACMYACEYPTEKAPNPDGDWPVILCAAVVGVAYPITPCRADFPSGPLPPTSPEDCKFYGAPMEAKFDTHIVPVRGPDYLAAEAHHAEFHELVFREDAQLLPLALIWFKKALS